MDVVTQVPRESRNWTIDDLERLPDDGRRYELVDGRLLISSAPTKKHQRVVGELYLVLRTSCPPELMVYVAPLDWQPDRHNSFQPDLLVVPDENPDEKNVTGVLDLAVEVLSSSTRDRDLVGKRAKYESMGVTSYWVVDPEAPSLLAWDLVNGRYRVVGSAAGGQRLDLRLPFPVSLTPLALLTGYHW
jgi:Uma2 family endonuclease